MKVLNYTTSYFALILLIIIPIWAGLFYYAMLDEIYDSIDDGLDNQKGLIIQKAAVDSSILNKSNFEEGDYAITEIPASNSTSYRDIYSDTMMYMQNEKDFEPVRLLKTVFNHKGKYYHMQIVTSMVEEDDLLTELFYALFWLYIGLVATILVLNNFLLKRIWRPFYHLLNQVKGFKLENATSFNVKKTSIDEFRLLNEAVEKLIRNNTDSYNSQKHFIENASHELQTPLAISINKLEVLAETGRLTEAELQLVASALDNLERLARLNKSLLLLSRIENNQFIESVQVDINQVVKSIAEDFSDQLQFSRISLQIHEQDGLIVAMNKDLALILITNLFKNAIVHNHPDGTIKISISSYSLSIENTGKTLALSEQKMFSRFNKEQPSDNSTGLGLAIVKAIVDLYSFKIVYSFPGAHQLTLSFK